MYRLTLNFFLILSLISFSDADFTLPIAICKWSDSCQRNQAWCGTKFNIGSDEWIRYATTKHGDRSIRCRQVCGGLTANSQYWCMLPRVWECFLGWLQSSRMQMQFYEWLLQHKQCKRLLRRYVVGSVEDHEDSSLYPRARTIIVPTLLWKHTLDLFCSRIKEYKLHGPCQTDK